MRRVAAIVVLLFIHGCVTAPPKLTPDIGITVPNEWTTANAGHGIVGGPWWESFQNPELNAVVRETLERNYDIKAAAARLEIAAADATIVGSDLFPQISAGFDPRRQRQNIPGPGNDVTKIISNSFGLSLNISWEIDIWGRIRSGKRAALAEYQAAEDEFQSARLSLAAQAVKSWAAVVEAKRQVKLADDTVATFDETARIVRARSEAGVALPSDLHLALANLAAARALRESELNNLDARLRQLQILIANYPTGAFDAPIELPEVSGTVPAGLPSELLKRRPDIGAAERRLAASESRIDQSEAALYPRLSLTASGGSSSEELSNLLSGKFAVWSLAANFLQPIFEGGRLRARVDRAKAESKQIYADYANTVLIAFAEVETTLAAENKLAQRERDLTIATEQAKEARRVAELRYRYGVETFITVLEAQRRALDNESQLIAVKRRRIDNRADLHLALGGGF
jgi:outer membrane protein, multidrug efflux system